LAEIPGDGKQGYYSMVEAVDHFRLDPTNILYIHKVFNNLLLCWQGVWMHPYIITTTTVAPHFENLDEILGYGLVQIIPICYG
jgi:hypothetical protein